MDKIDPPEPSVGLSVWTELRKKSAMERSKLAFAVFYIPASFAAVAVSFCFFEPSWIAGGGPFFAKAAQAAAKMPLEILLAHAAGLAGAAASQCADPIDRRAAASSKLWILKCSLPFLCAPAWAAAPYFSLGPFCAFLCACCLAICYPFWKSLGKDPCIGRAEAARLCLPAALLWTLPAAALAHGAFWESAAPGFGPRQASATLEQAAQCAAGAALADIAEQERETSGLPQSPNR